MVTMTDTGVATKFSFSAVLKDGTRKGLQVWKWSGSEGLSKPYRFEIDLATDDLKFSYPDLLGCRAVFQAEGQGASLWHGIVTQVLMTGVEEQDDGTGVGASYLYLKVVLEPRMAALAKDRLSRVHTLTENPDGRELSYLIRYAMRQCKLDEELPQTEATADTNKRGDFDFSIRLRDKTDTWDGSDFFFQFQESTFNFLSRHLEHRGVYYWFEQGEKKEGIVFYDDKPDFDKHPDGVVKVVWQGKEGLTPDLSRPTFFRLSHHFDASCGAIGQDNFNPLAADVSLKANVNVPDARPEAGTYHQMGMRRYFGGRYQKVDVSQRLAQLRVEEEVCNRSRYVAVGFATGIHAGQVIDLEDHPLQALNQRYLVVETTHEGEQALPHKIETASVDGPLRMSTKLVIIPADVQFRPSRKAQRPYVAGLLSAIVERPRDATPPPSPTQDATTGQDSQNKDGKNGNDGSKDASKKPEDRSWVKPYLNEHGQYRIRFLLADNAEVEEKKTTPEAAAGRNSAWVRMATPYAGRTDKPDGDFGMYFPLKEHTEVLVAFLDGDPDEPVIVAAVPNSRQLALATSKDNTNEVTGFIMPSGNTLAFKNKEGMETVLISSPVADSYIVLGGNEQDEANQGVLINTRSHITLSAESKKDIVEGKGYQRVYSLMPSKGEAEPSGNFFEAEHKFKQGWLHPDSGASFSIQKPKVSFDLSISAPSLDFSAKLAFEMSLAISAKYSLEFSLDRGFNFLDREKTEKKSEIKIQQRDVTAVEDRLTVGTREEVILNQASAYGGYRASTKGVHHIEAEGGILLAAVDQLPDMKVDEVTPAETTETPDSLLTKLIASVSPIAIGKSIKKKLFPESEQDVNAVTLDAAIDKSIEGAEVAINDAHTVFALTPDRFVLQGKTQGSIHGEEGVVRFTKKLQLESDHLICMEIDNMRLSLDADRGSVWDGDDKPVKIQSGSSSVRIEPAGVSVDSAKFESRAELTKLG